MFCQRYLGLIAASLTATFALAFTEPTEAHHSVTIDGTKHWCAGETHGSDKNNSCKLSSKKLTSVPADLFSDLPNLEWINLSFNSLSSVPEGLFSILTNIRHIDLNHNSLSSIPESLFSGLTNLQYINFRRNNLSSVSEDLFIGLLTWKQFG